MKVGDRPKRKRKRIRKWVAGRWMQKRTSAGLICNSTKARRHDAYQRHCAPADPRPDRHWNPTLPLTSPRLASPRDAYGLPAGLAAQHRRSGKDRRCTGLYIFHFPCAFPARNLHTSILLAARLGHSVKPTSLTLERLWNGHARSGQLDPVQAIRAVQCSAVQLMGMSVGCVCMILFSASLLAWRVGR